jgi:hypothetical protein
MACAGPHRDCQADAHPGRRRTRNSRAGADTIGVPPANTIDELEHAGVRGRPQVALADTQHWNEEHIDEVVANKHVQVLIPPESRTRDQPRPGWTGGRYDWMRAVLNGGVGPKPSGTLGLGPQGGRTPSRCPDRRDTDAVARVRAWRRSA